MTRIIAGEFRGRRLQVPAGRDVRPTTDRMRERLFSMLMHPRYGELEGACVADLFAGTGALGLEALSRGATTVTFVEKSRGSLDCLQENIKALRASGRCKIVRTSATGLPNTDEAFDFVFIDPPYRKGLLRPALDSLVAQGWVDGKTTLICELAADEPIDLPPEFIIVDDRSQGQQRILIMGCNSISD